jgi:hypothetical protein
MPTLSHLAQGAVVYGNFAGPAVTYQNVTEVPTQLPGPTPAALFGPPSLSGNSLLFNPVNFVDSASAGALEFQDGRLTFNVIPTSSQGNIKSISLLEGGAWTVGGGTSATTAKESLLINELFITSVNGISVNPIVVPPSIAFTDTNNGSASVSTSSNSITFSSSAGFSSGTWDATASFNFANALTGAGLSGNVTGLSMELDNQLSVTSETNSVAFIDKKYLDVTSNSSPVPEPSVAGLTAITAGCLSMIRKRR